MARRTRWSWPAGTGTRYADRFLVGIFLDTAVIENHTQPEEEIHNMITRVSCGDSKCSNYGIKKSVAIAGFEKHYTGRCEGQS
jgi:hypothetical protein